MPKLICDVAMEDMLDVANELSSHQKINGIAFKLDTRPKKLFG